MWRAGSGVDEPVLQRGGEMGEGTEVFVVPGFFTRYDGMQSVMKIVTPLGVDAIPGRLAGPDDSRIIQVAFGNKNQVAAKHCFEGVHLIRQLFEKVTGRGVDER